MNWTDWIFLITLGVVADFLVRALLQYAGGKRHITISLQVPISFLPSDRDDLKRWIKLELDRQLREAGFSAPEEKR